MKEYLFEFSVQRPAPKGRRGETSPEPIPPLVQTVRFEARADDEAIAHALREFRKIVTLRLFRMEEVPLP